MAAMNSLAPHKPAQLVQAAQRQFPDLEFAASDHFSWLARLGRITYDDHRSGADFAASLYHEIGHSQLNHRSFSSDVELLIMERQAWTWARQTLASLGHKLDDQLVEDSLDTYREWLYRRALCPQCNLVGFQTERQLYHCIFCRHSWRVPTSRLCQVRRTVIKPSK